MGRLIIGMEAEGKRFGYLEIFVLQEKSFRILIKKNDLTNKILTVSGQEETGSLTDFKSDIFEPPERKVVRNDRIYPNYWHASNNPVLSNGLAVVFCIMKENCGRQEFLKQVRVLCK